MLKTLPVIFFLLPVFAAAQTDILVLKKGGQDIHTYTIGDELNMETVYHQWFHGMIVDMRHDSIFIGGTAFNYKEIATIQRTRSGSGLLLFGTGMMIAGGGIFVLGAVNGLYRGDQSKDWYTSSGLITGGALVAAGFLMRKAYTKKYRLGGRYKLDYLQLSPNKK